MIEYTTVRSDASDEFTERRSRFIGYIRPARTEEEAVAFINEKKSAHWDAAHNVYAYILREGQTRRYSDDGEPQGTAGMPVLDVLQKLAVDAAERMTVSECTELALEFGYDLYGKISYILPKYHARTTFSDFGAVVRLQILLRDCDLPPFEKELTELTAAQVVPQAIEKRFACIEG